MKALVLDILFSLFSRMIHGKRPDRAKRSPQWPAVEHAHRLREPACQWCGTLLHVEVHHIAGFEEHPELELVDTNLISLCRPPGSVYGSCHFVRGHTAPGASHPNWKTYCPDIRMRCQDHQRGLIR